MYKPIHFFKVSNDVARVFKEAAEDLSQFAQCGYDFLSHILDIKINIRRPLGVMRRVRCVCPPPVVLPLGLRNLPVRPAPPSPKCGSSMAKCGSSMAEPVPRALRGSQMPL